MDTLRFCKSVRRPPWSHEQSVGLGDIRHHDGQVASNRVEAVLGAVQGQTETKHLQRWIGSSAMALRTAETDTDGSIHLPYLDVTRGEPVKCPF